MENHFYHIRWPPLIDAILLRTCVNALWELHQWWACLQNKLPLGFSQPGNIVKCSTKISMFYFIFMNIKTQTNDAVFFIITVIQGLCFKWLLTFLNLNQNLTLPEYKILAGIKISEYDQEILQSQTADKPMTSWGRATQQSGDTRKTNKEKQPVLSSPSRWWTLVTHNKT